MKNLFTNLSNFTFFYRTHSNILPVPKLEPLVPELIRKKTNFISRLILFDMPHSRQFVCEYLAKCHKLENKMIFHCISIRDSYIAAADNK